MIAGLEKPTSGRIYFGDEDVTDFTTRKAWNWFSVPKLCVISSYDSTSKYYVPT